MKNFTRKRIFFSLFLAGISLSANAQLTQRWVRHFSTSSVNGMGAVTPARVLLDNNRNVIVGGSIDFWVGPNMFLGYDSIDVAVVKYDLNGNLIWSNFFHCPSDSFDIANDMYVDHSGNIYITGYGFDMNQQKGILTLKFDANGNFLWYDLVNLNPNAFDEGRFIRENANGDIIVCAQTQDSTTHAFKAVLLTYSQAGTLNSTRIPDSLSTKEYRIADFELDTLGNYYIGSTSAFNTAYNIIKCDVAGNVLLNQDYTANHAYELNAIDVDPTGNIYLTGMRMLMSLDYLTVKLNPSGSVLWQQIYDGPGASHDQAKDIKVDRNGNVYVTGNDIGIGTNEDVCTIKYNAAGQWQWTTRMDSTGNDDFGLKLYLDRFNDVYVMSRQHVLNECFVTLKYNQSGQQQWMGYYMRSGGGDYPRDFLVDDSLNVYVTGSTPDVFSELGTIKYSQPFEMIGMDEHTQGAFSMYPNPANDQLTITGKGNQPVTIELYDLNGKLVMKTVSAAGQSISVAKLAASIYFCVIRDEEGILAKQKISVAR